MLFDYTKIVICMLLNEIMLQLVFLSTPLKVWEIIIQVALWNWISWMNTCFYFLGKVNYCFQIQWILHNL